MFALIQFLNLSTIRIRTKSSAMSFTDLDLSSKALTNILTAIMVFEFSYDGVCSLDKTWTPFRKLTELWKVKNKFIRSSFVLMLFKLIDLK